MQLFFWQPIPSFHQQGFLNALADADWVQTVHLRYESDIPEELKASGWPEPQWKDVDAARIQSDSSPVDRDDAVHVFSGFRTHPEVWKVFDRLPLRRRARAYAYAEAPALYGWKGPLRQIKFQRHARSLRGRLDGVLAVGGKGERFYQKVLGNGTPIHRFAYYDLPERDFPSFEARANHSRSELLYVGRLVHLKGLDRLFRALAAVRDGPDWQLTLVGSGPEAARLERLAKTLRIGERLRWEPAVSAAEVGAFYRQSDVLLQPSRGDGWGMTLPEALRHGCEVVATEACGAADLAKPGYRLPPDEKAWPGILAEVLQSGPLDNEQRKRNQQRARAFSAEAGVERLRRILQQECTTAPHT